METETSLFDVERAAQKLGGISPWTLRKHIARGTIAAVRIGRRVFIANAEMRRIEGDGLPSLRTTDARTSKLKVS
jgi:hypothetical protein